MHWGLQVVCFMVGRSPLLPDGAWLPATTRLHDGYEPLGSCNSLHMSSSGPVLGAAAHSTCTHLTASCKRPSALLQTQSAQIVVVLPAARVDTSPSPACLPCCKHKALR